MEIEGEKKSEKNWSKAASIDNSRKKHVRKKARKMESKAEIKAAERKREEEIKRAGRNDSVMKSVSGHYFTHTDLIPRRVVTAARNYEGEEEGWRKEWREEKSRRRGRDCPSESP